jgi:hypothetical protein
MEARILHCVPDCPRRGIAVHFGHMYIHQDCIERIADGYTYSFRTIVDGHNLMPGLLCNAKNPGVAVGFAGR